MLFYSKSIMFDINCVMGSNAFEDCEVEVHYAITEELDKLIQGQESQDIYNMTDQIQFSSVVIPDDLKPYLENLRSDQDRIIADVTEHFTEDLGNLIEAVSEAAVE